MAREGEKRSHIRKRKKGCLTGCLTNILLVLGVAAAIFVGAHVLGFVKTDSSQRIFWNVSVPFEYQPAVLSAYPQYLLLAR